MLVTHALQADPRFLHRADPAYWHPAYETLLDGLAYPCAPLGDFITHLTYGPIIVGQELPSADQGVALVNQTQIGAAGVDLRKATLVPPGCAWDRAPARLQTGDLVIARSGVGSLGKNRLAVFMEDQAAVVGSFVDLVRLQGLEPVYVALFLKTSYGWGQIHRLINGVAMPNLSFGELRGLQVALLPDPLQQELTDAYLGQVLPLHRAGDSAAGAAFQRLIRHTEALLTAHC